MAYWPFMGADIPRSTLIDWCGQAAAAIRPIANLIRAEVMATDRLHADDTGAHAHSRVGMGSRHADPRARP